MLFKEIVDTHTHAHMHARMDGRTDDGPSQKLTLST